jgi:hypothetical protein
MSIPSSSRSALIGVLIAAGLALAIIFSAQQWRIAHEREGASVIHQTVPRVPGPAETLAHTIAPLLPAPDARPPCPACDKIDEIARRFQATGHLPPIPRARPAQAPHVVAAKPHPAAHATRHKRHRTSCGSSGICGAEPAPQANWSHWYPGLVR